MTDVNDLTDSLDLVVYLLRANWQKTTISKPIIDYSHDILNRHGNIIIVYRTAYVTQRCDMQFDYENTISRISLDIRVDVPNFTTFTTMVNEAKRCLMTSRKNPNTTYSRIEIMSETEMNEPKKRFRKIIDIEVHKICQAIAT